MATMKLYDGREGQSASCCSSWIRFVVLVFLCIMGFCGMFIFDIPGSLQNSITSNLGLSTFQFSLFYSLYSWPSVVVCFFGGYLLDRYLGVELGSILVTSIQLIGVSLTVAGGFLDTLWLMLFGRFVFGIGGELCCVCVDMFILMWFKGKELNTIFAVIQNTLRLGTSAVYLVSTPLQQRLKHMTLSDQQSLNYTLLVLCSSSIIPLLLSVILAFMRPKRDDKETDKEEFNMSDIKQLPITFWLLSILTNVYSHALYTFLAFSQEFFTSQYNLSDVSANQLSSLFNIIPVVLGTLLAILVDRVARNMIFIILSVVLAIVAHAFAATFCSPYLIIITFSVSSSLMIGSFLPTLAYSVDKSQQGTAYGINQSVFNLVSSVGALIAGSIISDSGFLAVEIYYISILFGVLALSILTWWLDSKSKKVLNMSYSQRILFDGNI